MWESLDDPVQKQVEGVVMAADYQYPPDRLGVGDDSPDDDRRLRGSPDVIREHSFRVSTCFDVM
jgi:hypothetical protein